MSSTWDLLGGPMIILNSKQAAMNLLMKRGVLYSDRPDFHGLNCQYIPFFTPLAASQQCRIKWDTTLSFQRYGSYLFARPRRKPSMQEAWRLSVPFRCNMRTRF